MLIIRRNDLNYYHNGQSLIMQRNAAERQRTRSEARVDYTLSPIEAERQLYTHGICLFFSLPSPPLLRPPLLPFAVCWLRAARGWKVYFFHACTKRLHKFQAVACVLLCVLLLVYFESCFAFFSVCHNNNSGDEETYLR